MSHKASSGGRRRGFTRVGGIYGELLAEFFGTLVLIALGTGSVAMAVAGLPGSSRTAEPTVFFQGAGDWMIIVWGWAFAVAFGAYLAGGVSGAHINPAVTFALAVRRGFPWRKVPGYWAAQVLGAFAGAAIVYAVYRDAINAHELATGTARESGEAVASFSIFATFPAGYFDGWTGPFLDQVVGTALLLVLILALIDARSHLFSAYLGPLLIGFVVAAIGLSFGANAGYAINPARDLGPRLLAYFAGWGDVAIPGTMTTDELTFHNYMWIPIVGPLLGAVIGAFLYDFFIGKTLQARQEDATDTAPAPVESQDETLPEAANAATTHDGMASTEPATPVRPFGRTD